MATTFSGSYPIEHRDGEVERLRIQSDAFEPETRNMFARIGVASGWKCLDLGCGPVGVTRILSDMVGPTGKVTGLDMDEGFLRVARSGSAPNTTYVVGDAYRTGLPEKTFDLVHTRFVAGTSGHPEALFAEAIRLTRRGGFVALQEPDLRSLAAYPPHPAFSRLRTALIEAFSGVGADVTCAHNFYGMLRALGLTDVVYRPFIVGVHSTDALVDYLPSTVESLRHTVLRLGLVDELQLDADLAACRNHLARPDTVFTMFTVVQTWGRLTT